MKITKASSIKIAQKSSQNGARSIPLIELEIQQMVSNYISCAATSGESSTELTKTMDCDNERNAMNKIVLELINQGYQVTAKIEGHNVFNLSISWA